MAAAAAASKPPGRATQPVEVPSRGYGQIPDTYFEHLFFCLPPLAWGVVGQLLHQTKWGDGAISRTQQRDWFRRDQQEWARELRITEDGLRKALRDAAPVLEMRNVGKRLEYRVLVAEFARQPYRDVARSGNPTPKRRDGQPTPEPADVWEAVKEALAEGLSEADQKRLEPTRLMRFSPAVLSVQVPDEATRKWLESKAETVTEAAGAVLGTQGRVEFLLAAEAQPHQNSRSGDTGASGAKSHKNSRSGENDGPSPRTKGLAHLEALQKKGVKTPRGNVWEIVQERIFKRDPSTRLPGTFSSMTDDALRVTVTLAEQARLMGMEPEILRVLHGDLHFEGMAVQYVRDSRDSSSAPDVPASSPGERRSTLIAWLEEQGHGTQLPGVIRDPEAAEFWRLSKLLPWPRFEQTVTAKLRSGYPVRSWRLILRLVQDAAEEYASRKAR